MNAHMDYPFFLPKIKFFHFLKLDKNEINFGNER